MYPWLAGAAATVMLGVAGGNSYNDAVDAEIDRTAHPERPIPRGELTPKDARAWAWTWFGLALGLAFLLGLAAGFLALAYVGGLTWYEGRLKRSHVWGHLVVSLVVGGVFVFGAVVVSGLPYVPGVDSWTGWAGEPGLRAAAVMGFLAGLANLGRELLKSVEDQEADRAARRTAALVWGTGPTRAAAAGCLLFACLFAVVAVPLRVFPPLPYLALIAPALACFAAAPLLRSARDAVRVTKAGMAIALVGFVALVLI